MASSRFELLYDAGISYAVHVTNGNFGFGLRSDLHGFHSKIRCLQPIAKQRNIRSQGLYKSLSGPANDLLRRRLLNSALRDLPCVNDNCLVQSFNGYNGLSP